MTTHERSLRRLGAALLSALPLALIVSVGCCCPEPKTAAAIPDNPQHLEKAKALLATAEQKKVWTLSDEREFGHHQANLSRETRLTLARQLARDINSKAIRIDRTPPRGKGPPICPCVPGLCEGVTTATQAPADTATPPDASMATPPAAPMPTRKK